MGGDNQDLNLTIRAKDEATDTINKVQKSLGEVSQGMEKTGKASESMATSVFKGTLAYEALRKSVSLAVDFFKDSISESMEASRVMTQVRTNVKNAGFAYDELAPKLEEYSKNAVQLGFDDETAAQSLSKLLIVTKDYDQARALTNLSMDLAANKNISLEDATRGVIMVTQGNTKALKEYGIEMGDGATTADILVEAQKRVAGSAAEAASTAGGMAKTLNEEFANLKQNIGDELMPSIIDFFQIIKENKQTIIAMADTFIFLGKAVGFAAKGVVGFGKMIATGVSAAAETGTRYVANMAGGLNYLGLVSDETVKKTEDMADSWHETTKNAAEDALDLYDAVPKLNKTFDDTSKALAGVKNKADSAGQAIEKLQKIATGKQDIGTEIVDQEKKIADITEEIRSKTVEQEKNAKDANVDLERQYELSQEIFKLQADMVKEKEALERVKTSGLNVGPEVAEARRRAGLTEFERKIEDISSSDFGIKSIVMPSAAPSVGGTNINFNFSGTVAGDEGIKKIITDTINKLNRQTSLKTMAGV